MKRPPPHRQQQLHVLKEDELDRTSVMRLLKALVHYQCVVSDDLRQVLIEHIQVCI